MSSSSSEEEEVNNTSRGSGINIDDSHDGNDEIEGPDGDTLRIMVSTDNHLGYCERDPVRGLDSFAAFEEVLVLARQRKCDMVLIAGDLFHDNKPSRRTLHKTMEIIRRCCLGPNPVAIKIVSDQATNFRSVHGTVNYEDEFYSVDLPVFSIHGNHDDPTRDGGTEMLAALDLLAVSNLVNYFGRQDEVDKVEVSPILMQKGSTRVALYGMGSMRDERLNRMWQGKKVRFLRAENDDEKDGDEDDDEDDGDNEEGGTESKWFNIFSLHQNRDLGRGVKNCVHESMIPEWMDLVVWGHEHECRIEPQESLVGTFRITQPGSSVATSLTAGEAVRKQVGILEIRGQQFRMTTIPLLNVRSFVMGEISLKDRDELDADDPKIDTKVSSILEEEVNQLIYEAREKFKELRQDARSGGNAIAVKPSQLKYKLQKPKEVLVRLKVDHTDFSTLNNQRFGSRFVGQVANPSDILLFHRKKQEASSQTKSKKKRNNALEAPMAPEELEEINVKDLVRENLENDDKKLEILNMNRLGVALEDFVDKEQTRSIHEAMSDMLAKQQKQLIKRREDSNAAAAKEEAEMSREDMSQDAEEDRPKSQKKISKRKAADTSFDDKENLDDDDFNDMEVQTAPKKAANSRSSKSKATSRAKPKTPRSRNIYEDDDDDDEIEEVSPLPPKTSQSRRGGARPRRNAGTKVQYNVDDDSNSDGSEDSEAVVEIQDDGGDLLDDIEDEPKPKKRSRTATSSSTRKNSRASSQTQLSFMETKPTKSTPKSSSSSKRISSKKRSVDVYEIDDSDDDNNMKGGLSASQSMASGWGTASTSSFPSQSSRRR